jgi:hypothetical protein
LQLASTCIKIAFHISSIIYILYFQENTYGPAFEVPALVFSIHFNLDLYKMFIWNRTEVYVYITGY